MDTSITTNRVNSNSEIKECVKRLENYTTLFDIENLFLILNDLMTDCYEELNKEYYSDAKITLDKMFSMFWVIKDKLPDILFEDIEKVVFYLKDQLENETPN